MNTMQTEYRKLRTEGHAPFAALDLMRAWRKASTKDLCRISGAWPHRVVCELGRLGGELAKLEAVECMALEACERGAK